MANPFEGFPFLRRTEDEIPASLWNLWRRWRARFGAALEIPLAARPGTAFVATDEFWLMLDTTQGGAPLIMWLDFMVEGRDALHAPVPCFVQYYDYAGSRFRDEALDEARQHMEADLGRD